MQAPVNYTVVLDASVLVPRFLSNFLLWLAEMDLYRARWSEDIHQEWINARHTRFKVALENSHARRLQIDDAFPEGLVLNYQSLIDGLELPDKNDRHVLAAAIKCGANAILTSNLRDFPESTLNRFNIQVVNQDDFVLDQLGLTGDSARLVAIAMVRHKKSLTRTNSTWRQYFEAMSRPGVGLKKTHAELTTVRFKVIIFDVLTSGEWQAEY